MANIIVGVASPVISIIFGALILWRPKLLAYLVGFYLLLIGLLGLIAAL